MLTDGMGDGMHTFGVVWRAERAFRKRGVRHRHPIRTASLPAAPCTAVRDVLLTTVRSAAPSWRMEWATECTLSVSFASSGVPSVLSGSRGRGLVIWGSYSGALRFP